MPPQVSPHDDPPFSRWAVALAVGLTVPFWWILWLGGGLIGGDIYSYSMPQKVFLADALARNEIPLWNPLVGAGYPVLAESQTGALYPLHLVLYRLLEVQTAWTAVLLTHYIAAFLAMVWCARRLGLQSAGALLAAIVYVYGWFPPRSSLEWAILGGVYLPLALGSVAAYWSTRQPRFAVMLSLALGLQLLGGHYQIAFLTWLMIGAYSAWCLVRRELPAEGPEALPTKGRAALVLAGAFLLGVGLASVQLLPTWELKGRSQRAQVGGEHEPEYGHIPPLYLSQIVAPWMWYDLGIQFDAELAKLTWLSVPAATNRVEAHLYFGQIPWYLAIGALIAGFRRRDRTVLFWGLIAVLSVIYATGWLMPVLRYVPGFNFFRGPGRAGLLTTLAIAMLAGGALDGLRSRLSSWKSLWVTGLLVTLTIADLWWFPRNVNYALAIPDTPVQFLRQSLLKRRLSLQEGPVRLFAPGANMPTLMGVSATPVYLGLGPQEYFDPALMLPSADPDDFHTYTPERVAWLRRAGVTHILSFEELRGRGWPVEPLWAGFDPVLNFGWSRFDEPLYLYRLNDAPGRVVWESNDASATSKIASYTIHEVIVETDSTSPGRLVLKDLAYPGWRVTVDGQPAATLTVDGMYRAVDLSSGTHRVIWSYQPRAVYWGFCLSGVAAVLLAGGSWVLARRPPV